MILALTVLPLEGQQVLRLIDLQYFEIPLLFRIPLFPAGPASIHLVLGPAFNRMTSINQLSTGSLKNRTLSIQTHLGFDIC